MGWVGGDEGGEHMVGWHLQRSALQQQGVLHQMLAACCMLMRHGCMMGRVKRGCQTRTAACFSAAPCPHPSHSAAQRSAAAHLLTEVVAVAAAWPQLAEHSCLSGSDEGEGHAGTAVALVAHGGDEVDATGVARVPAIRQGSQRLQRGKWVRLQVPAAATCCCVVCAEQGGAGSSLGPP